MALVAALELEGVPSNETSQMFLFSCWQSWYQKTRPFLIFIGQSGKKSYCRAKHCFKSKTIFSRGA